MQKHRMEADLRRALERPGILVHYQPIIDTRRGGASCCEALVRWRHPERGMVSPADFIPLAEETGLIVEIGEWVLRQACRDAMSWPSLCAGRGEFGSATISGAEPHIHDRGRPRGFRAHRSARLELEITESTLMQDTSEVSRQACRDPGDGIATVAG